MTAINPTEGVGGTEVTITGTLFGPTDEDNKVTIGRTFYSDTLIFVS